HRSDGRGSGGACEGRSFHAAQNDCDAAGRGGWPSADAFGSRGEERSVWGLNKLLLLRQPRTRLVVTSGARVVVQRGGPTAAGSDGRIGDYFDKNGCGFGSRYKAAGE